MNDPSDPFSHLPELAEFATACRRLTERGWSEATGGNLSLRLDAGRFPEPGETSGPPVALPLAVPRLAGRYLLITGSGTRARDVAADPAAGVGLYRVTSDGRGYVWLAGNDRPTSELPSHLAIHDTLERARPTHTAVVHTHPTRLIALTHLQELRDSRSLSDTLLSMQSEARLHLPEGIGYQEFHPPGSLEMGLDSAVHLERRPVLLWHMHGALATGAGTAGALDLLEVVDKAADIYWTLRSAGIRPDGLDEEDLRASLSRYGKLDRYLMAFPSDTPPGGHADTTDDTPPDRHADTGLEPLTTEDDRKEHHQ